MRLPLLTLATGALLLAQAPSANPVADSMKASVRNTERNLLEAVEKVPDSMMAFKPVPEVMTFAELVGHIVDVEYMVCSAVKGEANPNSTSLQKAGLSKEAAVAAVKKSNDYCAAALEPLKDADLSSAVQLFGRPGTKASALTALVFHSPLHYGNLITYMRLKGIVPPETERAQRPRPAAKQ
jgi:uncharacterized damage-inducible protein DinB